MKKIQHLFILALPLLLASCNGNDDSSVVEGKINFITPYEEASIASEEAANKAISKPTFSKEGYTVYGYYKDASFDEEFDFTQIITEPTNIYVKMLKGEGTEASPYDISSGLALNSLTHMGKEMKVVASLSQDINLVSKYTDEYENTTFTGTFLGNGHKVSLDIDATTNGNNAGLFYKIGENGTVKDINLVGAIEGNHSSTGGIANLNYGTISNIVTFGTTKHKDGGDGSNGYSNGVSLMTTFDLEDTTIVIDDFGTVGELDTLSKGGAGGIAGTNYGTIKDCMNEMQVKATIGAGSMAGINYGTITNCVNRGAIGTTGVYSVNSTIIRDPAFSFSYIGGIAGANFGTVTQSVNTNQVFVARLPWLFNDAPAGQSDYCGRVRVGGIVGYNCGTYDTSKFSYTGGIVSECVNYGRVHGDMQVGGIAGYSNGSVTDCEAFCQIAGRNSVGSVVGWQAGDKEGDRIGVVSRCVALTRVYGGTFPAEMKDIDDNTYTGTSLTARSSSVAQSNIVDSFTVAKYATSCVWHSYNGNQDPLDPTTKTKITKATFSASSGLTQDVYNTVGKVIDEDDQTVDSGLWTYEDPSKASAALALNSSYNFVYSVYPKWQAKKITYVIDGVTASIDNALVGINYVSNLVTLGSNNRPNVNAANAAFPSAAISGRALGTRTMRGYTNICWVTKEGDKNSEWDGVVRDNVTVYLYKEAVA